MNFLFLYIIISAFIISNIHNLHASQGEYQHPKYESEDGEDTRALGQPQNTLEQSTRKRALVENYVTNNSSPRKKVRNEGGKAEVIEINDSLSTNSETEEENDSLSTNSETEEETALPLEKNCFSITHKSEIQRTNGALNKTLTHQSSLTNLPAQPVTPTSPAYNIPMTLSIDIEDHTTNNLQTQPSLTLSSADPQSISAQLLSYPPFEKLKEADGHVQLPMGTFELPNSFQMLDDSIAFELLKDIFPKNPAQVLKRSPRSTTVNKILKEKGLGTREQRIIFALSNIKDKKERENIIKGAQRLSNFYKTTKNPSGAMSNDFLEHLLKLSDMRNSSFFTEVFDSLKHKNEKGKLEYLRDTISAEYKKLLLKNSTNYENPFNSRNIVGNSSLSTRPAIGRSTSPNNNNIASYTNFSLTNSTNSQAHENPFDSRNIIANSSLSTRPAIGRSPYPQNNSVDSSNFFSSSFLGQSSTSLFQPPLLTPQLFTIPLTALTPNRFLALVPMEVTVPMVALTAPFQPNVNHPTSALPSSILPENSLEPPKLPQTSLITLRHFPNPPVSRATSYFPQKSNK